MTTLADLANDHASVTYGEGDGASLTIQYHPQRATSLPTLEFLRELQNWDQVGAGIDEVIDISRRLSGVLSDLIIAWDALEPDGSVVELSPERLGREGLPVLVSLFGAIVKDSRRSLGELTGTRSPKPMSGTSARRAGSTTSRAGASRRK